MTKLSRIFKKLSKKVILGILAILIIGAPLLYLTLLNSNPAQAAWFDDNWLYRQRADITNSSGSNQTNSIATFTIDTTDTSKFQSTCNDIRMADNTGKLISFWFESCNNAATRVWVQVPSLPSGGGTIYVYYGNPSASATNYKTNSIFSFFDNFDDNSVDTSKWTSAGTGTKEETGGEQHTANSGSWGHARFYTTSSQNINNKVIEFDTRFPTNSGWNQKSEMFYGSANLATVSWGGFYNTSSLFQVYTTQSGSWASRGSSTYVFANNVTYHVKITDTGTAVSFVISEGATSRYSPGSINRDANTTSYIHIGDGEGGDESYHDNFKMYSYVNSSSTLASEEKAPGPKLYWQFDDPSAGSGLVAQDSSSNNLNGTLNNTPAWNTEDLCLSGKCLYFDGSSNENVSRADNALLDFAAADNFTLSAWVRKSGAASANTVILGKASANIGATYQGYKLYMDASGDFCFDTQDGTLAVDSACTSAVDFDDDKWHLVQGVKTGTTSITLYVDGKQRAQDASIASTGSLANSGTFYAGIDSDGLAIEWKGFIDEVKVYDYARSSAQVLTDFSSRGSIKGVSAQIGSPDQWKSLSEGLVGYWKMEESSDGTGAVTRNDSSGNGNTLTDNNTTVSGTGKFGNGADFEADNSEYLSITDASQTGLDITGPITITAWIKFESTNPPYIPVIVSKSIQDTTNLGYKFYLANPGGSNATIKFDVSSNGTSFNGSVDGSTWFTAGTWYHVVGIYDGSNLKVYLNGNLDNSTAYSSGIYNNSSSFRIGAVGINGDNSVISSQTFDGLIDEARVYNRALSDKEVRDLYNFAPGPSGYWNFEEKSGSTANDTSGNGNSGSISGAAWADGKFGASLNFDGSDDVTTVTNATAIDLNSSGAFTYSTWIYADSAGEGSGGQVYNKGSTTFLRVDTLSGSNLDVEAQLDLATTDATLNISSAIATGVWNHIVVTYEDDSDDEISIYINGVLKGTSTDGSGSIAAESNNLLIGGPTTDNFDGKIDDFKFYNYARTGKQIVSDMNAGHPAVGSPVSSAVAYWDLDEGYGASASDFTGNSNTLTLSSASWTNSGKFGKAWNGTGALWLSRADDADFDFTASESFTVSLWYKTDSANNPGATEYLVSKGPLSAAGYGIYANTDGTVCFGIDDDITWNPDISSCTSTDVYDNTWHHVIGVRDVTADKTLIYIDGVLKDSDTDSTSETLANSSSLYIGDSNGADGTDEFNGDIDEVKIYRYALTKDEILTDYNRGSSLILGAAGDNSTYQPNAANQEYCIPGDTASCAAPVGRWDFEEGTGTTVNDTSGTGNAGTWNGTSNHWVTGKYGSGGYFDGTNDYISLTSTPTTGTGSFSIFAWIKTSSTSTRKQIVSYGSDTTNQGEWFFVNTSNQVESDLSNTAGPSSTATVTDGKWHHVGVVNSSGSFQIYVDGQTSGSSSSMSPNIGTANTPVIGSGMGAQLNNWRFNGRIDDVRIYNYARSVAQVALDYNRGAPVAYWDLDECQGSSVYDLSPSAGSGQAGNNGTITIGASGTQTSAGTCLTSGTAWGNGVSGKRNYSLNFDGTDDRVSAATSTTIPSISASAWVKLSAFNDPHNPIVMLDSSGGSCGTWCESFYFFVGSAGKFTMARFYSWGVTGKAWDCTNASCSLTTSKWYHIAFSQDGNNSNTVNFYINGVLVQSVTSPQTTWGAGTYPTTGNSFKIGGNADMGGYYTPGQIDDVKIYNYALTATQVKDLYNQGAVFFGPTTGSP